MSFPQYPAYKDSGVEWLSEVPDDWSIVPLKHMAEFSNGFAFKPGEWSDEGVPIIRIENLNGGDEFNYFSGEVEERYQVEAGDLLFAWSGNRGTSFGPFVWSRSGMHYLNQHIFKVLGFQGDGAWLYWCLKAVTQHVEEQAHGIIGMVHITKGKLGAIKACLPDSTVQSTIATFLDRETAKIDALIAEQERLITLLAEKRQAVISYAVTKGLDPTAPMKDSGVEWLGEVPGHWAIAPLKYLVHLQSGGTPSKDRLEYWDGNVPWASAKDMKVEYLRDTEDHLSEIAIEERAATLLEENTVVVVVRGMILARAFPVALTLTRMAINQDLKAVRTRHRLFPSFLAWYLRGTAAESLRRLDEAGHGTKALRMDAWTSLTLVVPPYQDQRDIAAYLDDQTTKLDTLTTESHHAITLLKERRTALISAAVTGKIDVRGLAAEAAA